MSLSLNFLYSIYFLIDKLIYYTFNTVYTPLVEVALVLKAKIKTISTGGVDKLLSPQNSITDGFGLDRRKSFETAQTVIGHGFEFNLQNSQEKPRQWKFVGVEIRTEL